MLRRWRLSSTRRPASPFRGQSSFGSLTARDESSCKLALAVPAWAAVFALRFAFKVRRETHILRSCSPHLTPSFRDATCAPALLRGLRLNSESHDPAFDVSDSSGCVTAVSMLKRHAVALGSSGLLQQKCRIGKMHIKGRDGIFTLYDIGETHLLAFQSKVM